MSAQFASLWNLLQECRSLEPHMGKIAAEEVTRNVFLRVNHTGRRIAECRAGAELRGGIED